MATLIVGTFDFYRSAGVARDSCSQRPTKTLHVSCENVPAVGHLGALLAAAGDNIFSDLFSPFLLFELLSKFKFLHLFRQGPTHDVKQFGSADSLAFLFPQPSSNSM